MTKKRKVKRSIWHDAEVTIVIFAWSSKKYAKRVAKRARKNGFIIQDERKDKRHEPEA